MGLDKYFESVAVSCDIGYMKPHPKCYQYTLDEMKLDAAECVMVGDSLRADVQGAQALGMTAVWRRVRKEDPPHEPEQVGEGPHGDGDVTAPANRAQTGRALGNYAEGEVAEPGLHDLDVVGTHGASDSRQAMTVAMDKLTPGG